MTTHLLCSLDVCSPAVHHQLSLAPLTILRGRNGSGKSTILKAVEALFEGPSGHTWPILGRGPGDLSVRGVLELDGRRHVLARHRTSGKHTCSLNGEMVGPSVAKGRFAALIGSAALVHPDKAMTATPRELQGMLSSLVQVPSTCAGMLRAIGVALGTADEELSWGDLDLFTGVPADVDSAIAILRAVVNERHAALNAARSARDELVDDTPDMPSMTRDAANRVLAELRAAETANQHALAQRATLSTWAADRRHAANNVTRCQQAVTSTSAAIDEMESKLAQHEEKRQKARARVDQLTTRERDTREELRELASKRSVLERRASSAKTLPSELVDLGEPLQGVRATDDTPPASKAALRRIVALLGDARAADEVREQLSIVQNREGGCRRLREGLTTQRAAAVERAAATDSDIARVQSTLTQLRATRNKQRAAERAAARTLSELEARRPEEPESLSTDYDSLLSQADGARAALDGWAAADAHARLKTRAMKAVSTRETAWRRAKTAREALMHYAAKLVADGINRHLDKASSVMREVAGWRLRAELSKGATIWLDDVREQRPSVQLGAASGSQRALALIAFHIALLQGQPGLRLLRLDELGILDSESRAALYPALAKLVDGGALHQVVLAGVVDDPTPTHFTSITLGA